MTLEEFGPFMVEQRKKKNLTQAQLAEQLNVSTAAISKWERCLCLPDITKFNDIAKVFDLSLMEVMQCKESEVATGEIDDVINDSINPEKDRCRRKAKGWRSGLIVLFVSWLAAILFEQYGIDPDLIVLSGIISGLIICLSDGAKRD